MSLLDFSCCSVRIFLNKTQAPYKTKLKPGKAKRQTSTSFCGIRMVSADKHWQSKIGQKITMTQIWQHAIYLNLLSAVPVLMTCTLFCQNSLINSVFAMGLLIGQFLKLSYNRLYNWPAKIIIITTIGSQNTSQILAAKYFPALKRVNVFHWSIQTHWGEFSNLRLRWKRF